MKKVALSTLALASALVVATPASAALDLTGLTLQTGHSFPSIGVYDAGPSDFTVGTTAPISYIGISDHAIGASTYLINVYCGIDCGWTSTEFNGFVMSDPFDVAPSFTSVSINAATSYAGFDASRLTFDANTVSVNLQGLDANGSIIIDINGASAAVPEPASWALLIAGFGMVGFAMRRRIALTA